MEQVRMIVVGCERVQTVKQKKNNGCWYKVTCRDDKGGIRHYPTTSAMFGFIQRDLQDSGEFLARITLEAASQYDNVHYSLSKRLVLYDIEQVQPPNTVS